MPCLRAYLYVPNAGKLSLQIQELTAVYDPTSAMIETSNSSACSKRLERFEVTRVPPWLARHHHGMAPPPSRHEPGNLPG